MQKGSKREQNKDSDQMNTENDELLKQPDSKAGNDYSMWEKKLNLN